MFTAQYLRIGKHSYNDVRITNEETKETFDIALNGKTLRELREFLNGRGPKGPKVYRKEESESSPPETSRRG